MSQESRKSLDLARRSFERSHNSLRRRTSGEVLKLVETQQHLAPVKLAPLVVCYLLISPLLPPISSLATFFSSSTKSKTGEIDIDSRLASHPSLVIWGTGDSFTLQKKLQWWAEDIYRSRTPSFFTYWKVDGGGHFWRKPHAERLMRQYLREWVQGISLSAMVGWRSPKRSEP